MNNIDVDLKAFDVISEDIDVKIQDFHVMNNSIDVKLKDFDVIVDNFDVKQKDLDGILYVKLTDFDDILILTQKNTFFGDFRSNRFF